tara:strand:- start:274 stop:534 length:261 start_codon:yes stop_codon:yes gene_type:complete
MSTQKKKVAHDHPSIESTMKSIETLLEKLDNSDTPLDQSLLAFEEGIQLIRMAQKQLSEAEQKVQLLMEEDGAPTSTDMNLDESTK